MIALGVGINGAMFSVIRGVLLAARAARVDPAAAFR